MSNEYTNAKRPRGRNRALPAPEGESNNLPERLQEHPVGKNRVEADRKHVWQDNRYESNPSRTCTVCGITVRTHFIQADKRGLEYHYTDAYNNSISSMKPLACPAFIGETNGAVLENRNNLRKTNDRADMTETRVGGMENWAGQVEGWAGGVEARLRQLEAENAELRATVEAPIDVTDFVAWLAEMTQIHRDRKGKSVPMQLAGRAYALPAPVAGIIELVGTVEDERELEPLPIKRGRKTG